MPGRSGRKGRIQKKSTVKIKLKEIVCRGNENDISETTKMEYPISRKRKADNGKYYPCA